MPHLQKTLYTTKPPYLSELIAHYLPIHPGPPFIRSFNTNHLARPYDITRNCSSRSFFVSASPRLPGTLGLNTFAVSTILSTSKCQLISYLFQSAFFRLITLCQSLRFVLRFLGFINMCMYVCKYACLAVLFKHIVN